MANRFLNNIRINDAYTFPDDDGTVGQAILTDGAGNLSFGTVSSGEADSAIKILLTVKNVSSGTLTSGTVVRVATTSNPPSGNVLEVDIADNSAASTMPAVGVLIEDITAGSEGDCVAFGRASGFSTSGYTEGDTLYVNTSGDFTTTKPTGTALIQRIGQVIKVHASNGSIEVFGAGRANDVPNLPVGKIWVGTASNTDESTVIHLDETNNRLGINDTTPGVTLDISGTDAIKIPAGTEAERPTGVAGMLRYNSDDAQFEGYTTEWGAIAGSGGGTVTIEKNVYTGNGSDTTFNTTSTISSENNVQIYLDGVYQSKDNYTTSGNVVTFSTAPPDGVSVELIHITSVSANIIKDTGSGNNSTTIFPLSNTIDNENNVQVYIDGAYQSKDNYTVSGSNLTFSTAPPTGTNNIEFIHIKPTSSSASVNYSVSVISSNTNAEKNYLYVITGTCTLALPSSPTNGDSIKVSNRSGVATATIARNGEKIMGAASDLTLDKLNSGFEMIYSGSAEGWVLIGVEGTAA